MRQSLLDAYWDVVCDGVSCKDATERHGVDRGQLKKARSDRWKMLMLSFLQSLPEADHERMQLDFSLFNDLVLFWNLDVYFPSC